MRRIDRREFARDASLAFLGGITVTVSACGGGSGSSPTASNPPAPTPAASGDPGDEVGEISANHGHQAIITAAMLMAGGAVQLHIMGNADHDHVVNLPAQAVQEARDGRPVQTESTTTQGHTHRVTFNPESPDPPSPY